MHDMERLSVAAGGWLISPEHTEGVAANLRALFNSSNYLPSEADAPLTLSQQTGASFWPEPGTPLARLRPYDVSDGVLTIPVRGVLLHRFPYSFYGIATGYTYIQEAILRALDDTGVTAIVLDVDSPGGTVSGCFDTADLIYESRGKKTIAAVCNEFAFSAAYAVASAADSITVPRTGGVGSIGVLGTHVDISKMLDNLGVEFNFVFAGKRKLDGRPEIPLSGEARARMQTRVDATYRIFVETVARNRGMKKSAVRETEADIFTAPESVKNGLADEIAPYIDAVAALRAASTTNQRGDNMSKDKTAAKQAAPETARIAADDSGKTYTEADLATARENGAATERGRITAIMESDEAKSRPAAAKQVAFKTDMSAEDAKSFLSGLPEEKASAESTPAAGGGNAFEAAMAQGNPEVGAGAPGESADGKSDVAEGFFGSLGMAANQ